jgi:hypothetical protein
LASAVSSAVNSNAGNRLGAKEAITLLKGLLTYVPIKRKLHYAKLLSTRLKRKATRAAILDNLLADVFIQQWKKYTPDFSSLFLNSGAHEQHHYMFNSKAYDGTQRNPDWYCPADDDPILDILQEYDLILSMLLQLDCRLLIATGLHQKPHLHETWYWRLNNHRVFLDQVGIKDGTVLPRMSRDFLVDFESEQAAQQAEYILKSITLNGLPIFAIDNRSNSLFVELVYPNNIEKGSLLHMSGQTTSLDIKDFVVFVAIKNGEHHEEGYWVDTAQKYQGESMPLTQVYNEIVSAF